MAVIKEYRCLAHGQFEGTEAICPHGCGTVVQEFRTAPGFKSNRTKSSDATLERLADRFDMTNMNIGKGEAAGSGMGPKGMAPVWGQMPKGNMFEAGVGERPMDGSQGGATAALDMYGINSRNESAVQEMAKSLNAPMPSFMDITQSMPKPRTNVVGNFGNAADLDRAVKT